MKQLIAVIALSLLFISCEKRVAVEPPSLDWENRETSLNTSDSLTYGKSYLPIYSRIYHYKRGKTLGLTITTSMRNVSPSDTVYLRSVELYDTFGNKVRGYTDKPVFLKPLETLEIVIEETEEDGGTGGNFIFDWALKDSKNPPLFEAVMISTLGDQGISFTTRAIRLE